MSVIVVLLIVIDFGVVSLRISRILAILVAIIGRGCNGISLGLIGGICGGVCLLLLNLPS